MLVSSLVHEFMCTYVIFMYTLVCVSVCHFALHIYAYLSSMFRSRLEAVFRFPSPLSSRDDLFSLSKGRVWSAGRRRSVAEGCGLETRDLQHASRDTISERWGERTHSKTQSQPRLHPSALAAAGLLLPKIPHLKNLSRKIARFFCLKNPSSDRRKSVY